MIDDRFYTRTARTTLGEIIAGLGADLSPSDQALKVSTISALETSTAGSLTYFGGRKYREQLIGASGSICICEPKDAQEVTDAGLTPVAAGYARAVFASAIDRAFDKIDFTPGDPAISPQASIDPSAKIMPGAVIGAGAVIAAGAVIGPNSVIYPGVSIGANSVIEANVTIQCAHLGMGCKIHSSASIGGDGFGVAASNSGTKDIPHIGRVIIGDNVSIGYGTMVDRGMLGDTVIKDGTKIDNLSQIAHNCVIGRNVMIAGHAGISGTVVVGDNVIMGGRVGIADHLTIGEGATLAASTSLMRDVPPGEVWAGFPAKPIRQYMREVATLSKLAKKPKKQ